jgi:hypothetical protein
MCVHACIHALCVCGWICLCVSLYVRVDGRLRLAYGFAVRLHGVPQDAVDRLSQPPRQRRVRAHKPYGAAPSHARRSLSQYTQRGRETDSQACLSARSCVCMCACVYMYMRVCVWASLLVRMARTLIEGGRLLDHHSATALRRRSPTAQRMLGCHQQHLAKAHTHTHTHTERERERERRVSV